MGGFFPYFRVEQATLLQAVVLSLLLALAAAVLPAVQASRLKVVECLRRVA